MRYSGRGEQRPPLPAFAIRAGLARAEATKQTHGATRDLCKTCLLGVNSGTGAQGR